MRQRKQFILRRFDLVQWAKSPKKQSVVSVFLTTWHCILTQLTEITMVRKLR